MSWRAGYDPETADEALTLEDAALRPTQNPWRCGNCGVELFTTSCIKAHKERCKPKPKTSPEKKPFKLQHDQRRNMVRQN